MGTDNLFHKRKAKTARDLDRRKAKRAPYAKVLIVCEGEKTEPFYFRGLINHYRLNSANIEICGDCGSAPSSIYQYAQQRYRESRDVGDPFNRVFCVFDKDTHESYKQTLLSIRDAKPKGIYQAITSVPCFEYWLILHFSYTEKPYHDLPKKSACDQILDQLRKNHISGYTKGDKNIFEKCVNKIESAKQNAARSLSDANKNNTDNPSTHIHELVDFLQKIKNQG